MAKTKTTTDKQTKGKKTLEELANKLPNVKNLLNKIEERKEEVSEISKEGVIETIQVETAQEEFHQEVMLTNEEPQKIDPLADELILDGVDEVFNPDEIKETVEAPKIAQVVQPSQANKEVVQQGFRVVATSDRRSLTTQPRIITPSRISTSTKINF